MKILCVLYDDPITGMPESYARDDLPKLNKYPLHCQNGSMRIPK